MDEPTPARRIVRRRDAFKKKLAISESMFERLELTDPTFPRRIQLGPKAVGYFEDEIDAWLESRRAAPFAKEAA